MDNKQAARELLRIAKKLIGRRKPIEEKKDLSRSELKRKLGGRKFRLRKVSFSDLARGEAVSLKVDGVPSGVMSHEDYEANKEILATINDLGDSYTYDGMHILV